MYLTIGKLMPHLTELRDCLIPETNDERIRSVYFRLEMLPYTLMALQDAFRECVDAQFQLLDRLSKSGLEAGVRRQLSEEDRQKLAFPVDRFLETARRCQNALVPYLSRGRSVGLPGSLREVVDQIDSRRIDLGEVLNDLVTGYWRSHGKRLRDYRVLSQHYAIVSSDARVFRSDEGQVCLYLLLPNNPEVQSASKLIYEAPNVHAFLYVREQFHKLVDIVYHITRHLLAACPERIDERGLKRVSMWIVPRVPVVIGGNKKLEGQKVILHDEMRQEIESGVTRNCELFEKRYGKRRGT